MFKAVFISSASALFAISACWAEPKLQKVDTARSRITFQSSSPTLPVSGQFTRYTGQVAVDVATQDLRQVAFNIDLSAPRFNQSASQFQWLVQGLLQNLSSPIAQFRSASVQRINNESAKAIGTVTMGTQHYALTVPIKIVRISGTLSQFSGVLNGNVSPQGLAQALQGELTFDLLFTN